MKHAAIAVSLAMTLMLPRIAGAQDKVALTLGAGAIFNATPPPAEDFTEPIYLLSVQRVLKQHFVLDGEVNYWAHTSRTDRGPHDVSGPNGVIGHADRITEISDNTYWDLGVNFLVKSTGAVRVFGGVGGGIVLQDETYSQQQFGCSASLPCNEYVNHYDRAFLLFRVLGGVEVPLTSRVAIVGTARWEDSSWESTRRNVSAIAAVRFGLQ
jgi:hypothetical protein